MLNASCQCVGTPDNTDTDGDGIPNCSDSCPTVPGQIGSACNDNNPCTDNDALNASCQCVGTPDNTDTDGDGIPNCSDSCPTVPGQIGSACNDNNPARPTMC
ncbi:MAG: thrombospondin type 3 repeat-containing protein [Flavobacteriales bacterium]|nr:thrombospondin type 3 repeat-containing protein [Flavobacteriales bacterium]